MPIPHHYIPVAFDPESAGQEKVSFTARTPVPTPIKVVGVNVKTFTPCDENVHEATITVTSSKMMSAVLFRIDNRLADLPAFNVDNIGQSGKAIIKYKDDKDGCHDCIHPIDVNCENPRPPKALTPAVEGDLFQVRLEITGYASGAVVTAAVALCYESPDG